MGPAAASTDAPELQKKKALNMLQTVDDGLTQREKVIMVKLFTKDADTTLTFINLDDPVLCQAWLRDVLEEYNANDERRQIAGT
jgi:hypothetical protein